MNDDVGGLDYDCALAAAILIIERFQARPGATTPELVSFATFTVLESIKEARRREHRRRVAAPSPN